MNDFQRYENCIIDNKGSIIVDVGSNKIYYFDFIHMTVTIGGKTSKKPIRYVSDTQKLRIWGTSSWIRFDNLNLEKAIAILFDNHNEQILLGDDRG